MIVRDQLARRLAALLRDDPRRVLLGEDARDGGMLGLTRACVEDPELEARVIGTPLVPALALAHAGGLAIAGLRPIVALPSAAALYEGFAALRELCRLSLCTDDERSAPALLLAPCGPGLGLGGDGADELSSLLAPLSGLRVLACSDPREAAALVREAAEFTAGEQPTVVLLPRDQLFVDVGDAVDTLEEPVALRRLRHGDRATVFCWGAAAARALAAVDALEVAVDVIELRALSPLDRAGLVAAAARTGKLVIAHPGPSAFGVAAELAALFADAAILHLDAPVLRVGGEAGPLARDTEGRALPSVAAITEAILRVVTF